MDLGVSVFHLADVAIPVVEAFPCSHLYFLSIPLPTYMIPGKGADGNTASIC